jgi:hypothetical protein
MAAQKTEFDKQMLHLDAEIRRLEAEYNMFFAGRLPRPPFETKNRVHALVKKHDNSFIRNTADRFRFETLQTRYYKFMELVEKQMTAKELGRPMIGRIALAPKPAAPPRPAAEPAPAQASPERARESAEKNAEKAEKIVKFGRDDAADSRVKELYEQLAAAKKQVGEAPVAYERVAALVKAQVSKFGDENTNVAFKIALKDGKVSLTVKPEKGGD